MNFSLLLGNYKSRIALVIFVALLPFFALDFYKNWHSRENIKERTIEKTILYMNSLARTHEAMIFSVKKEMMLFSKIPAIQAARNPDCKELFQEFEALSSSYANLGVIRDGGEIICSLVPLDRASNEAIKTMVRAREEERFVVGEVIASSRYDHLIMIFAMPLESGEALQLVGGGRLTWFNESSLMQNLGKFISFYVLDGNRRVVGAYPARAEIIGQELDEPIDRENLEKVASPQGLWWQEGHSPEGRYTHLILDSARGVELVAVLDNEMIEEEATKLFWSSLAYLALMIFIAGSLAIFTAKEFIIKEVNSLFKLAICQSKYTATSELLSSIAHQWRQPLNALNLQIALLRDSIEYGTADSKECAEYLESMESSIQSLSQGITKYSGFFKRDKVKESFMLHEAIREAISFVDASLEEDGIVIELSGEDVPIVQYRKDLAQNLLSLFQNSIEAFENMGEMSKPKRIQIETKKVRQKAVIVIRDNAGGIDEAMVEKIFQPYSTTKFQSDGVGLSLFMFKSIIEREMGGSVHVQNVGGGAEFVIEIPLF